MILDIRFPPVVYKKLMGKKCDLRDVSKLMPELAKGLQLVCVYATGVCVCVCEFLCV